MNALKIAQNTQAEMLRLSSVKSTDLNSLMAQVQFLRHEVEKWKTRAERDSLTGCLRRESFLEIIEHRKRAGWLSGLVSLAVIDLDYFKKVNDTHGHHAGDLVLSKVGTLLRNSLPQGSLVCRAGGEEFVVLIPQDTKTALETLNQVRKQIETSEIEIDENKKINVSASMGLAEWNTNSPMLNASVQADMALYQAKKGGRNQVVKS